MARGQPARPTAPPYSPALLERMNRDLTLDPAPARAALGVECRPFRSDFRTKG